MTMLARLSLITLLLVVAATLASGCFTVLRHPGSQMLLSDDSDDHGSRRACADCHQDSRFYHDAFDPSYYGFGPYAIDPGWSDYYYRPWWYADYWYYPAPPASQQTVQTSTTPHVWGDQGRRDMTPFPVIGGGTSGGGAPSSGSSSGTPTNPEPDAEPSKPSGRSEDSKDEEPHRAPERREMTPKPPPPPPN